MALDQTSTVASQTDDTEKAEHPGTWVRLPCCDHAVHPVRIVNQCDGVIEITHPKEPHETWVQRPEPGAAVTLGWTDSGGTLVLSCIVLADPDPSAWKLQVIGTGDFMQRRRHIRVSTNAVAQLMDGQLDKVVAAKLIDISESGMKCSFTDYVPDERMNPFRFALRIDGAVLVVVANMRWSGRINPIEVNAGFEFLEVHDALVSRIRAHIMHQLDTRGREEL